MHVLHLLLLAGVSVAQRTRGTIINFEPPDPNDWVFNVIFKIRDIYSRHKNGKIVSDPKLDLFSMSLEQYCVDSNEVPQITPLQWYQPQKPKCTGEHYYLFKLLYDEYVIDCLRMTTALREVALASIKPVVIKRFYLKVFYLTTSGDCYVKFFELPVRTCYSDGHVKLSPARCDEFFPLVPENIVQSSSYESDYPDIKPV